MARYVRHIRNALCLFALAVSLLGAQTLDDVTFVLRIPPIMDLAGVQLTKVDSVLVTVRINQLRVAQLRGLSNEWFIVRVPLQECDVANSDNVVGVLDGKVDFGDFFAYVDHFGERGPGLAVDFDGDDDVDFDDFFILVDHFGESIFGAKARAYAAAEDFEFDLLRTVPGARKVMEYDPARWDQAMQRSVVPSQLLGRDKLIAYVRIFNILGQAQSNIIPVSNHEAFADAVQHDQNGRSYAKGVYLVGYFDQSEQLVGSRKFTPGVNDVLTPAMLAPEHAVARIRQSVGNTLSQPAAKTTVLVVNYQVEVASLTGSFSTQTISVAGSSGSSREIQIFVDTPVESPSKEASQIMLHENLAAAGVSLDSLFQNDDTQNSNYVIIEGGESFGIQNRRLVPIVPLSQVGTTYRVVVRATDGSSTAEAVITITVAEPLDTTPPAARLTMPSLREIIYTAGDDLSYPIAGTLAVETVDTLAFSSLVPVERSFPVGALLLGTYHVSLTVMDAAGNRSAVLDSIVVDDAIPPGLSVTVSDSTVDYEVSEDLSFPVRVTLTVTAGENVVCADSVIFGQDQNPFAGSTTCENLGLGEFGVLLSATDASGREASATGMIVIDVLTRQEFVVFVPDTIGTNQSIEFIAEILTYENDEIARRDTVQVDGGNTLKSGSESGEWQITVTYGDFSVTKTVITRRWVNAWAQLTRYTRSSWQGSGIDMRFDVSGSDELAATGTATLATEGRADSVLNISLNLGIEDTRQWGAATFVPPQNNSQDRQTWNVVFGVRLRDYPDISDTAFVQFTQDPKPTDETDGSSGGSTSGGSGGGDTGGGATTPPSPQPVIEGGPNADVTVLAVGDRVNLYVATRDASRIEWYANGNHVGEGNSLGWSPSAEYSGPITIEVRAINNSGSDTKTASARTTILVIGAPPGL